MVDLKKYEEKYIWRCTFSDGVIDEMYETNDGKLIETPFKEVNQKDDFEKMELISDIPEFDTNISVNKDGLFTLLNKKYLFKLINNDEESKDLLSGFHNNLIMYRTDAMLPNGKPFRYGYTIGYKVSNDDIFARVKFTTGAEGANFKVEITAKKDFSKPLTFIVHDPDKDKGTNQQIKLIKDKTITISIN